MKILITGCAGFIGFHLAKRLIEDKNQVVGIDNINNYYDKRLKIDRINILKRNKKFHFKKIDISNLKALRKIFKNNKFDQVINLAAYAGVEYSLKYPEKYIYTNELGFFFILEMIKKYKIPKLIFASSSSIYGLNKLPFDENQYTDKPISLYGATKKNNEVLAHYYAKQFNIDIMGIRFFTVYGPYGRPDLSIFKFCKQILTNKTLKLYNKGRNYRDFTYIDDLIVNLRKLIYLRNKKRSYNLINISSGKKIKILNLVRILEKNLFKKAKIKLEKKIPTDITASLSYSRKLKKIFKVNKFTSFEKGIQKFVSWYRSYYNA
tara:strand:- start:41024 stop:41983 length:960 start_codon:yes stop_codon:yes gene_type:complete